MRKNVEEGLRSRGQTGTSTIAGDFQNLKMMTPAFPDKKTQPENLLNSKNSNKNVRISKDKKVY